MQVYQREGNSLEKSIESINLRDLRNNMIHNKYTEVIPNNELLKFNVNFETLQSYLNQDIFATVFVLPTGPNTYTVYHIDFSDTDITVRRVGVKPI